MEAKNVGNITRYIAAQGGISPEAAYSAARTGVTVMIEDMQTNGGCSGPHFADYERNYREYISDPALSHLAVRASSAETQTSSESSPFEQKLALLESSGNPTCRGLGNTLRNSNSGGEELILRSAEKYGCLVE